jgi:hypothetical protein
MSKIRVYCVGIHFRHHIDFTPDITVGTDKYMTGAAILAACAKTWKLRYKLSSNPPSAVGGHIDYVGYTPNSDNDNEVTDHGSAPRVTFAAFGAKEFPFFGQPLSLTEILAPIGQASQVLQYSVQPLVTGTSPVKLLVPKKANPIVPTPPADFGPAAEISPDNDGRSSFGVVGFPSDVEIRIRSLNIYCTY